MEIIDEVFSSDDEENLPQPTEIEDDPAIVEEAANLTVLAKSEVATTPSKEEDLSLEGQFVTKLDVIEDEDWPKRMSDYGYTASQRAYVERSLAKKRELFDFRN